MSNLIDSLKIVFCATIFLMILSPTVGHAVTKDYGDITTNGWFWLGGNERWDLTQCDLTISYTLDMSAYIPPMWNTQWSSVGVGNGAWGWMSSGAPAAFDTNPNSQDLDDKLNLGAPDRYDESSYDATGPDTLVIPPIGDPWSNFGVWFDRDGVDPWQALMWGMIDGVTYNTGGIYDVVVTYHAIDSTTGTMFATVNGVQTGFYDTWKNDQPDHYPLGKSISGDLSQLQIFASIWGQNNVKVYDLEVTGCMYLPVDIDIKPGSFPNSINPNAGGVIPVAILTTENFDALTVDPMTVALNGVNARGKGKSGNYGSMEDVDGDGDLDLVVQIENTITWAADATQATMTGLTYDGIPIEGTDSVNIVPPE